MGREHDPVRGRWYENLEDGDVFMVLSVDEDAELVEIQYEDGDIEEMIAEARSLAEAECRRAFITQTWKMVLDEFPDGDTIRIPLPPLASVTHVKYYDTSGVQQTWSSTKYHVAIGGEPRSRFYVKR